MKVCSLYGAGFYYIPGTDICMKIGGYVRYQVSSGVGNNISFGPFNTSGGFNTRADNADYAQRTRITLSQDTRQQTAYGTLRTYLILGWTHDSPANGLSPAGASLYFNRGFIQIAGFTFGKSTSFFDFASTAAVAYNAGFVSTSDTGDPGQMGAAYTAQFGNGMSATISVEQSRRLATVYLTGAAGGGFGAGMGGPAPDNLGGALTATPCTAVGGNANGAGCNNRPDIVANWRFDQAWGSAQIMGALHDNSAAYYGGATALEASNHPSDKWGWAAGVGFRFNTPMIGPGDYFQIQGTYAEGATKYSSMSGCAGNNVCDSFGSGNTFAFGYATDSVFGGTAGSGAGPGGIWGNNIELTTSWSVFGSYEHFWTPALRTSVYGSYLDISHNANATGMICTAFLGAAAVAAGTQCSPDFQVWTIGSRSQWNVTKDFYVGIDVLYNKLQSATLNNGAPVALAAGSIFLPANKNPGLYSTADQDQVSVTWRVHRDIVP